ncbi:MAG: acyl-ACP--UDP-N-acetylglucosamine O-acyltransferase [Deltaproteobacteria bacterium]|nr:acyl-ACP--UDP-N-acetylglucosamine O-acyltransferase [Deltaproteobacteria bacterium]
MIDARAVVHPDAQLDEGVEVGPFAIVGPHVKIGRGVTIGAHALVDGWTTLGEGCRVFPFASVGAVPQDLKYRGEETYLEIGARTVIREFASLNLGTVGGGGVTRIGNDCLLMAYTHVAHDCRIGDRVILANGATLAGHIAIGDWAAIGGLTAVHQFVRIGEHAYVGGCSAVVMDVPPYCTASGNRAKLYGFNLVGLKRRGFTDEVLKDLRRVYRIIFRSKETLSQALETVRGGPEYERPEVQSFVEFIARSERGMTR